MQIRSGESPGLGEEEWDTVAQQWQEIKPPNHVGLQGSGSGVAGEGLGVPALELAKHFKNKLMDPKVLSGWAPVIHQEHKGV